MITWMRGNLMLTGIIVGAIAAELHHRKQGAP